MIGVMGNAMNGLVDTTLSGVIDTPLNVVIDTNIWLDLLVFDDPGSRRLSSLLESHALASFATAPMRAELADVLTRPKFGQTHDRQAAQLDRFDQLTTLAADAPDCRLACRDPDDRKFLDLAVARRLDWLLSRDRALLACRKAARVRFGLNIGTPADFYRWLDATEARPASR